jgi:hypothetical protein
MIASICEILRTEYSSTKPVSAKNILSACQTAPRHGPRGGAGYGAKACAARGELITPAARLSDNPARWEELPFELARLPAQVHHDRATTRNASVADLAAV